MSATFDEDQPCLYCGSPNAHECAGVPVCDECCIDATDIEIAFPKAKRFLQRIIDYRVHGEAAPAPQHLPLSREEFMAQIRPKREDSLE